MSHPGVARAREIVGKYANEVMTLTIDTVDAGLRLEVLLKSEIGAAADKKLPPDPAPSAFSLLASDTDGYTITSGAFTGLRGFFTCDASGAVVGVDLAGRLYSLVPTAAE